MINSVELTAKKLVNELRTTGSVQSLKFFKNLSKSELKMTFDSSDIENLKNIGMLYFMMLQDDYFEEDPDERQLLAAIGYYVLSLGIQKTINNIGVPLNPLDWIELLKIRILLISYSKASITFNLAMMPSEKVEYFSLGSPNRYQKEKKDLSNMVVSDAAEIKRWSESELVSVMANKFQSKAIKLADQIINDNRRFIQNSNIEEIIYTGKEVHKKFFNFLKNKFDNLESVDATEFIW